MTIILTATTTAAIRKFQPGADRQLANDDDGGIDTAH